MRDDDGSDLEATFADSPTHSSFAGGGRQRASTFRSVRLWLALAGLSLVPLAGLGYAAFADFGPTGPEAAEADGETSEDAGDVGATRAGRGAKRAKARTDGAAPCCAKLRELGKTAPITDRASFLAAASSCDAAPTEERALSQVSSVLGGSRVAIPDECSGSE